MDKKIVLVTGAAQGLGAETAKAIAARGHCVAIVDIDAKNAELVAAACRRTSTDSFAISMDLAQPGVPFKMVEAVMSFTQRLDVLINCAAISPIEPFLGMTEAAWEKTLQVNVKAVALAMSAAGRIMATQRSGHIVNVTSAAARMAIANFAAYSATKAAVDCLTRCGAVALAPYGIRVNSFSPGMMDTFMQEQNEELLCKLDGRSDIAAYKAERTARVPLQRRTSPEEMAEALAWLALDSPAYMTAERLNLTGGLDKD